MGTKPFKSYEEQVSILQSRGMGIDDPAHAAEVLRTHNYYRLSGYGLRVKMCVWLGVSRGLDLAFLNAD